MGGIFGKLFGKKTETHEMSILSNISVGQKTPKSVVTVQGRRSKKR